MSTLFPIYTSHGDWAAILVGRYLYNPQGEWIGWLDGDSQVYSVRGDYAGWLTHDFRVLRKREAGYMEPRRDTPPAPPRLEVPTMVPLAPLMAELTYDVIDLFEDAPHHLDPADMDRVEDIE